MTENCLHCAGDTFRTKFKWSFRICDVIIVLSLLFNVMAFYLTHAYVAKEAEQQGKQVVLYESNPAQRALNKDFAVPPVKDVLFENWAFYKQLMIFAIIIVGYFYLRLSANQKEHLIGLQANTYVFFLVTGWDALRDLALVLAVT